MERKEILRHVDHTLLKQTATWDDIRATCDEAVSYGAASVCIPPCYVAPASAYLGDRLPVCTVIGFPNGNNTTASKVFEAEEAIKNGAKELDMVINIGRLRAGDCDYVLREIKALRSVTQGLILKVIIETCLLTEQEKVTMCRLVTESGADFIKTSTGFSTSGATKEDISLFREHVGPGVRIKAAGGISSFDDAEAFLALGAERLGTSRLIRIAMKEDAEQGK